MSSYGGVSVEWSGYNGIEWGKPGHEYIKLTGTLQRDLTMRVFGFHQGHADVEYNWEGTDGCTGGVKPTGSGKFKQSIQTNAVVTVGDLPSGLEDVVIQLQSPRDIDVQLWDGSKAIVKWNGGLLGGAGYQSLNYAGARIEWSGYNGDQSKDSNLVDILGNEYIRITGKLNRKLTMKVFGYRSGTADVFYWWGDCSPEFYANGISEICWIFDQHDWKTTDGSPWHKGDDAYAVDYNWGSGERDRGITLRSGTSGRVLWAGEGSVSGYGNTVVVQTGENANYAVRYAHLGQLFVQKGDWVNVGDRIGTNDRTGMGGSCSAPDWACSHLHMVLYKDVQRIADHGRTVASWLSTGGVPTYGRCCSGSATQHAAKFMLANPLP